jgi:hypothetical protein
VPEPFRTDSLAQSMIGTGADVLLVLGMCFVVVSGSVCEVRPPWLRTKRP